MRLSIEERKPIILQEAAKLLAFHGYAGLTTRKLADAAATRETILYRCFPSKEEIVLSCLVLAKDKQLKEWENMRSSSLSSLETLKKIVSVFVGRKSQESRNFLMLTRLNAEPLPEELRTEVKEVYSSWLDWLDILVANTLKEMDKDPAASRDKALALLHWGVGLGNLQLAELPESLDPLISARQMQLAFKMLEEL